MGTPWYADSEMPLYPPCATNTTRFLWARRSFWGTQSSSMKPASRNGAITSEMSVYCQCKQPDVEHQQL